MPMARQSGGADVGWLTDKIRNQLDGQYRQGVAPERQLLVPQGFQRVEPCGPKGGIEPDRGHFLMAAVIPNIRLAGLSARRRRYQAAHSEP